MLIAVKYQEERESRGEIQGVQGKDGGEKD